LPAAQTASTPPAAAALVAVFGSPAAAWLPSAPEGAAALEPAVLGAGAELADGDGVAPVLHAATRMAVTPNVAAIRELNLGTCHSSEMGLRSLNRDRSQETGCGFLPGVTASR
jgi:hypothetical protein